MNSNPRISFVSIYQYNKWNSYGHFGIMDYTKVPFLVAAAEQVTVKRFIFAGDFMLLFSTLLDIKDSVTEEDFVELVLEWSRTNPRPDNRLPAFVWHGESGFHVGIENLSLEYVADRERRISAFRHEKTGGDGVIWDTVFIMNFREKRMAIQLDRTYHEDALVMDASFSTPHIITVLIEHGFLKDDCGLPVLRTPIYVSDQDEEMLAEIFEEKRDYRLPVVFVSKTSEGADPLDVSWLASRLKGAAHVLAEESPDQCRKVRELCGGCDELYGAARIYYPSDSLRKKRCRFRSATGDGAVRLERVIRNVIQYWIVLKPEPLYTWQGVNNTLLSDRLKDQFSRWVEAETAKRKAEDEVDKVYEEFDQDLSELQEKVAELTRKNEELQYENQRLRARMAEADAVPVIFLGEEEEFYQGEIRDMILGTLDDGLHAAGESTRRADVLEDILENNPYYHLSDERKQRVKNLFKGYKSLTGAMRQELQSMGFEITEAGKHYKLTYRGDSRYMVTIGKTPSDNRSGNNNAALINKNML